MGKITGFLEIERHDRKYEPVADRLKTFNEFVIPLSEKDTRGLVSIYKLHLPNLNYAPKRRGPCGGD